VEGERHKREGGGRKGNERVTGGARDIKEGKYRVGTERQVEGNTKVGGGGK